MITETFRIFANEIYKGILISWHYKFEIVLGLLMTGGIFVGIGFFMGRGQLEQNQLSFLLIGYVMWLFAANIISSLSYELLNEAQAGTLEQIFMSPKHILIILLGRSFASLMIASINISLFVMAAVGGLAIHITPNLQSLIIFVITIAGLFGFGYIIAGATLVFKRVGALANLVVNALLFLNGSMFPVNQFPVWLATFANTLPTTEGITLLRKVLLDGQSLNSIWNNGSLTALFCHSAFYVGIGLLFFVFCMRNAKIAGSLGHY